MTTALWICACIAAFIVGAVVTAWYFLALQESERRIRAQKRAEYSRPERGGGGF